MNDFELLRRFQEGDDDAFGDIVRRHVGAVYSTARRVLQNPHLAQEVSQETFCLLARKAPQLPTDTVLIAWLHRAAWNIAMTTLRGEQRRRERDQLAGMISADSNEEASIWSQIEPVLDEGIEQLSEQERKAILLKFFDREKARDIGLVLGISDEAARARVSRAVEKLRVFFRSRGVTVSTLTLVSLIVANAVEVVPASKVSAILERLRGVTPMRGPLVFSDCGRNVMGRILSKAAIPLTFAITVISILCFTGGAYREGRAGFEIASEGKGRAGANISKRLKALRINPQIASAISGREQRGVASLVEFFKTAIVSPPVIERIRFTKQTLDWGEEYSITESTGNSTQFKLQYYGGAKAGENFFLSQILPPQDTGESTDSNIRSVRGRVGRGLYTIGSHQLSTTMAGTTDERQYVAAPVEGAAKFLNQTLQMGIGGLEPGTVIWNGSEFTGRTSQEIPIHGELELRSGLPFRLTVRDKKDKPPNYILEYAYPRPATLLGGYPSSIKMYRTIGGSMKFARTMEIKECKISVTPLESDHFASSQFMNEGITHTDGVRNKQLIDEINGGATLEAFLPIGNMVETEKPTRFH